MADIPATVSFLRTVRLFRDFSTQDLSALAGNLGERSMRKGQVLFREGDVGEEMYFVQQGTMVISKAVTGKVEQVLARAGAGDFFGEMSLFDRQPRSATLQAEIDARLLSLDRQHLTQLIDVSPRAAAAFFQSMLQAFIERLRETTGLVAEITRWGLEATGLDVDAR